MESHKSVTSGCEWSSPLAKTEQSVGGWADQDTEEPTKHSAAGLSCKKSWKRRGDECTKAKVLSIMFFDFLWIINLFVQPFLPQHRLNQDPSPIPFQLKEQGVGVLYQVICSSFNEKPILNHWFEDNSVQKYVLSLLAETEEEKIVQSSLISLHLFSKPGLRDLALSICSISYFPWWGGHRSSFFRKDNSFGSVWFRQLRWGLEVQMVWCFLILTLISLIIGTRTQSSAVVEANFQNSTESCIRWGSLVSTLLRRSSPEEPPGQIGGSIVELAPYTGFYFLLPKKESRTSSWTFSQSPGCW